MIAKKYILNWAALLMPAIAFCGLVVYFLATGVPRIVENEKRRVEESRKETARLLKEKKLASDFVWRYGEGVVEGDERFKARFPESMTWKQWNSRTGSKRAEKMWGVVDFKDDENHREIEAKLIWARDKQFVRGKICDIDETNYALLLWSGGLAAIFIVLSLSLFTVFKLVVYAKRRDDFMMASAHDLNLPLMGLRFTIGKDDDEARNICERLFRLVENIREFMHMRGKRKFSIAKTGLYAAYLEAYKVFALDFQDIYNGEDVEVEGDKSLEIMADETALVQIFWNILANELKYAAQYGKVAVAFSSSGGMAKIEIRDEGPGMTKKEMRRAFRRYWRGSKGFAKGGFGIGLCVARELAFAMKGKLTLRASAKGGVAFTLALPLAGGEANSCAKSREEPQR